MFKPYCHLILIVLLNLPFTGQSQDLIYGITGSSSGFNLASIDPTNGVVTIISPTSIAPSIMGMTSAVDPQNGIFYLIDSNENIIGIDMSTGTLISSAPITCTNCYSINHLIFNVYNNTIYCLAWEFNPTRVYLATVDPSTGIVNVLSGSPIGYVVGNAGYTLDPVNEVFYFAESTNFRGIDLNTGAIISDAPITAPYGNYFDIFQYNCSDSTIYGITTSSVQGQVTMAKINPATGNVTILSSTSYSNGITNMSYTLNPVDNIFYYRGPGTSFRSIDLNNGNLINTSTISAPFSFFIYSTQHCIPLSPVHEISSKGNDLIIYPNPSNGIFSIQSPPGQIRIFNSIGQMIFSNEIFDEKSVFDISQFPDGIYLLTHTKGSVIRSQKIILSR